MSEEEIDCDNPDNEDREECQCREPDSDDLYDAWADERVGEYFDILKERHELYRTLLKLWDNEKTHTNKVVARDKLEQHLVRNLTGEDGLWLNMNSIYEWFQEKDDPYKKNSV